MILNNKFNSNNNSNSNNNLNIYNKVRVDMSNKVLKLAKEKQTRNTCKL